MVEHCSQFPDVETGLPFTSTTKATALVLAVTGVTVLTTETKRSQLKALDAPPLLPQSK